MLVYRWKDGKVAGCLVTENPAELARMCRDLDDPKSEVEYRLPDDSLIVYWVDEETGRIYGKPSPADEKALLDKLARIAPGVTLHAADIAAEDPPRPGQGRGAGSRRKEGGKEL